MIKKKYLIFTIRFVTKIQPPAAAVSVMIDMILCFDQEDQTELPDVIGSSCR